MNLSVSVGKGKRVCVCARMFAYIFKRTVQKVAVKKCERWVDNCGIIFCRDCVFGCCFALGLQRIYIRI